MAPTSDLEGCADAHQRMAEVLGRLVADGVDPSAASALPGWTVGHVLTHLARQADGVRAMAEGALAGEERPMYASAEARDADIDAGAGRPLAELVDDVTTAAVALDAAWAALDETAWGGDGLTLRGPFPLRVMPSFRWREVEVHLTDLGLPQFTPADWSPAYVAWDTEARRATLVGRGDTIPPEVEAADAWQRLAWLLGRPVDGLPEPLPF